MFRSLCFCVLFLFLPHVEPKPVKNLFRFFFPELLEQTSQRVTFKNLNQVDWCKIDRRAEEKWDHLYEFGEQFHDVDIIGGGRKEGVELDFYLPFYGFRFNTTVILLEGAVAFSYDVYIEPPFVFPNPKWPNEFDPSFIAAFLGPQSMVFAGENLISHVFYRVIIRPWFTAFDRDFSRQMSFTSCPSESNHLKELDGRVEDPEFLDKVSRDIREGMVGARGFTADYALLVTWERMGSGGGTTQITPTPLNLYDKVKKWQNTFQLLIATDEVRTYIILNYAHINQTASAGTVFGRGSKQSPIVGFNGGNGTGFVSLPFAEEGNANKLVEFGNTPTAGRWIARVDERPMLGGCSNATIGNLQLHSRDIPMLGGFALNISGPCFRSTDSLKLYIEGFSLECTQINVVVARCMIPVDAFSRIGSVDVRLSVNGSNDLSYIAILNIVEPGSVLNKARLVADPIKQNNSWDSLDPEVLSILWSRENITTKAEARIDITLWGYSEDSIGNHSLVEIGLISLDVPNTGRYSFNPRTLNRNQNAPDAWKKFRGGLVQIKVSDWQPDDMGDGMYWSDLTPLPWFFRDQWASHYGRYWAEQMCFEWFDQEGKLSNLHQELEKEIPCPCSLDQALIDFGRFAAMPNCDMFGNAYCPNTRGAKHCVVSIQASSSGAGQTCCYDYNGWLMSSKDYEWDPNYLRFYSAGTPIRSHPYFHRPVLSNFHNDLLPYEMCCKWAGKCEFFFWRRQTSTCKHYRHSVIGSAFGQGHFLTYDGLRYPFQGKGYFVLSSMQTRYHDLMIQVRMEQPSETPLDTKVMASVITGLAARDDGSSVIQVFARKEFRRERYKMDVYVDGVPVFFDSPNKLRFFNGGLLQNPSMNMNNSEIWISFNTGVGIIVEEANGLLNIQTSLPWNYNQTQEGGRECNRQSMGLLGTYNGDWLDEFVTPECEIVMMVNRSDEIRCFPLMSCAPINEYIARDIYNNFGLKWMISQELLFQPEHQPLYDPLTFSLADYQPTFVPISTSYLFDVIYSRQEIEMKCEKEPECIFDFVTSNWQKIAMNTLYSLKKIQRLKELGETSLKSCGSFQKNRGALKFPPENNYLEGVTVWLECLPDYNLHGPNEQKCQNGSWTPGWWTQCQKRERLTFTGPCNTEKETSYNPLTDPFPRLCHFTKTIENNITTSPVKGKKKAVSKSKSSPCVDFYEFASQKKDSAPEELKVVLKRLLEQPEVKGDNDGEKLAKHYYSKCMDTTEKDLDSFLSLITNTKHVPKPIPHSWEHMAGVIFAKTGVSTIVQLNFGSENKLLVNVADLTGKPRNITTEAILELLEEIPIYKLNISYSRTQIENALDLWEKLSLYVNGTNNTSTADESVVISYAKLRKNASLNFKWNDFFDGVSDRKNLFNETQELEILGFENFEWIANYLSNFSAESIHNFLFLKMITSEEEINPVTLIIAEENRERWEYCVDKSLLLLHRPLLSLYLREQDPTTEIQLDIERLTTLLKVEFLEQAEAMNKTDLSNRIESLNVEFGGFEELDVAFSGVLHWNMSDTYKELSFFDISMLLTAVKVRENLLGQNYGPFFALQFASYAISESTLEIIVPVGVFPPHHQNTPNFGSLSTTIAMWMGSLIENEVKQIEAFESRCDTSQTNKTFGAGPSIGLKLAFGAFSKWHSESSNETLGNGFSAEQNFFIEIAKHVSQEQPIIGLDDQRKNRVNTALKRSADFSSAFACPCIKV